MRLACGMVCCFFRLRRSHMCTCLVPYSMYGEHFLRLQVYSEMKKAEEKIDQVVLGLKEERKQLRQQRAEAKENKDKASKRKQTRA